MQIVSKGMKIQTQFSCTTEKNTCIRMGPGILILKMAVHGKLVSCLELSTEMKEKKVKTARTGHD